MRDTLLLILLLVGLALIPAAPARAASSLLAVQLDPPVAGVRICWQTRCYETDAAGRWAHSVDVVAGTNYELVVTDGSVAVIGVQGAAGMSVTWVSDTRVRFRFAATPPASSGPITIYVSTAPQPAATTTPTAPKTVTAVPTTGTPEPTPWPTPTVWGGALGPEVRCVIEAGLLEAIQQQACLRPPLDPLELVLSPLYVAALAYAPGTAGSNWLLSPGVPLTGEVQIETPIGTATAMALADVYVLRIGARLWVCQWGACVWGEIRPGMTMEVGE